MSNFEKSAGAWGRRWFYPATWAPRTKLLIMVGLGASIVSLEVLRSFEKRKFHEEEMAFMDKYLEYASEGKQIRESLESKLEKHPTMVGNHEESKSRSLPRPNKE